MQRGYIYKHHGAWFVQHYDVRFVDGRPVRKRVARRLVSCGPDYPTKRSVWTLAEKILQPLNAAQLLPESALPLTEFIERFYLPYIKARLRPSTVNDYADIFKRHLRSRLGSIRLRDFRVVHGQRVMAAIPGVGHARLLRIKAVLSGVFAYAMREGIIDGPNPIHGVSVPGRPSHFKGGAYTLEEIDKMLLGLPAGIARTVVAVAAFTGLRLSELRGLRWGDYDGTNLHIRRTAWRTIVGPTKNIASEAAVPVLPVLCRVLDNHRNGQPDSAYIFAGERRGNPLNMHNLARRVIRPAIEARGVEWKGWHAFRRGLASNLYVLGVAPKVIQAIMRHSDIGTTLAFYVTTQDEESRAALASIEENLWFAG